MVTGNGQSELPHQSWRRAALGAETRDQPNFALLGDTLNRMRTPAGDGADEQGNRPRDRAAAAGSAAASGPEAATGSSVFAPGYSGNRRATDRAAGSGRGSQDASRWYGSTADGAAGKGPVRGYPPVPGQPPPMYPPGQFAAWNRSHHGQARPVAPPGQSGGTLADRGQPASGQPGGGQPGGGQPGGGRADSGQWGSGIAQPGRDDRPEAAWQSPTAAAGAGAAASTSRYYERTDSPEAEPGYSMLAVSDPAADVTSTQTWQALGDGRSTGIWTTPARSGAGPDRLAGPSRPAVPPARRSPDVAGPGEEAGSPDTAAASTALARTETSRTGSTRTDGTRTRARGHSGAHTGPQDTARTERAARSRRSLQPTGSPRSQRAANRKPRGKHPASIKLAITVAMLFVLAAAATLAYGVLHSPAKPKPTAGPTPKVTPSAAASPTLGPYGHIGSRSADPQPLTAAQLFPPSFNLAGQAVTRAATGAGQRCVAALDGANIRSAVRRADCDQVVRATYLAKSEGLMGTIGVLNLSTASGAVKRSGRPTPATSSVS